MKRYKLLKDLPTFNEGDVFYLSVLGHLVREKDGVIAYSKPTLEEFNILDSDWLEELPEEYKRWRAKEDKQYWFMDDDGEVYDNRDNRDSIDSGRYKLGNYFKTEEEAEKAVEWLKALTVLRDDTKGFKPNWSDPEQEKWFVFYNHNSRCFRSESNFACQGGNLYFASDDEANDSIKKHEREWKIFYGVEE